MEEEVTKKLSHEEFVRLAIVTLKMIDACGRRQPLSRSWMEAAMSSSVPKPERSLPNPKKG